MIFAVLAACGLTGGDAPVTPAAPGPAAAAPKQAAPAAPAAKPAPRGKPLAALVATSGNAEPLMDGDVKSTWKPYGDHANEGVLFRFEEPTSITGFTLVSCGPGQAVFTTYLDGVQVEGDIAIALENGLFRGEPREVRSVFLKVETWAPDACLGEVRFEGAEVAPPRTVLATVTASSELEPVAAYRSQYLFDSRLDFGWVEGAKDLGVGEWVQAELGRPVEVHALELWNGYQRSEDHFQKNARAKRIAIVTDGGRVEVDVPDTMGPSKLPLPAPVTTGKIRIEILEATPGTKYSDLVLTEARVWDGEGPLAFTTPMKQMAFGVLTRARGTHLERMIDYLLVSTCSPNKQLKIRSNSSFVWWVTNAEVSEVFDGAWVFRDSDAKGTGIQLYGRRHRTTEDWSPYGSGGVEETVRVAGGKPVFTRASQVDAATWDKGMAAVQKAYDEPCEMSWAEAKEKDAILVVGDAFTDVLVKDPSRG